MNLKSRLEIAASVSVIITCVALTSLAVASWMRSRSDVSRALQSDGSRDIHQPPYAKGQRVSEIAGLSYGAADYTILLFVRSTCPYCTQSMPFYRALRKRDQGINEGAAIQLIAISPESNSVVSGYLVANGLEVDRVVSDHVRGQLNLTVTPTLVIVNKEGVALGSWVGRLNRQLEGEVARLVGP